MNFHGFSLRPSNQMRSFSFRAFGHTIKKLECGPFLTTVVFTGRGRHLQQRRGRVMSRAGMWCEAVCYISESRSPRRPADLHAEGITNLWNVWQWSSTVTGPLPQQLRYLEHFQPEDGVAGNRVMCRTNGRASAADHFLALRVRMPQAAQLSVSCACCGLSLLRADRSSRGVLPGVVFLSVIGKPRQWGGSGQLRPFAPLRHPEFWSATYRKDLQPPHSPVH